MRAWLDGSGDSLTEIGIGLLLFAAASGWYRWMHFLWPFGQTPDDSDLPVEQMNRRFGAVFLALCGLTLVGQGMWELMA